MSDSPRFQGDEASLAPGAHHDAGVARWLALSPGGALRREAALPHLRRVVRRRGLRRIVGRSAVAVVCAGAVWMATGLKPGAQGRSSQGVGGAGGAGQRSPGTASAGHVPAGGAPARAQVPAHAVAVSRAVRTQIVAPSPGVLARLAISERPALRVRMVDDAELISTLAGAGVQASVVHVAGDAGVLRLPGLN